MASPTNTERATAGNWPQWMLEVAEIADSIKARGIRAARPAPAPLAPAPFDAAAARDELTRLVASHDPAFNHSDDYTFWRAEQVKADRIASLRGALAAHGAA
jgi:hypothetical protein